MPNDAPFREGEGIAWYVGAPGSGKTTLALRHVAYAYAGTSWPICVVDSTHAQQFAGRYHCRDVAEVLDVLYRQRQHAVWTPSNGEEVEQLCRGLRAGKRVVLLIDESAFWFNAQSGRQGEILRLMRGWRHAELRLLLTTQHLSGDVPQEAWACSPRVYVFRTTAPAGLKVLEREYGLTPERIRGLKVGEFLEVPEPPP